MRALILTFLVLIPALTLHAAGPTYLVVGDHQRWQGEVVLTQPILVAAGAVLEIAPGSVIRAESAENGIRVEGSVLAVGSEALPIVFATPEGWKGLELVQSTGENRFEYVQFHSAATAISSTLSQFRIVHGQFSECGIAVILHRQSQPLIEQSVFDRNRIAVDIEMRSQARLLNNLFRDNETAVLASHNSSGELRNNRFIGNQQGVRIQHQFPGVIADNQFEKNGQALLCDQTMESPQILTNRFVDNQQGVISLLASRPLVRNNRFTGNQQALVNNQLGSPRVEQNLFVDNRIAIVSERRSAPQIELNHFSENEVALLCDYLSYPSVKKNNFTGNHLAVKLGEHQSADMEKQGKSQQEVQAFLAESGRQGKMAIFAPASGTVDVRDNWWGENLTDAQLQPLFYGRLQSQWVVDNSTGERYLRDRIEFTPWRGEPVGNAGIE